MVRKERIDGNGNVPILIRIDLNRSPAAYDKCGGKSYRIPLAMWDPVRREVSSRHPTASLINMALTKRRLQLEETFLLREASGLKLTKGRIKALVAGKEPGRCFYTFCKQQIQEKYESKETRRT